MGFEWPILLLALLLVPLFGVLHVTAQTKRRRYLLSYSDVSLLARAAAQTSGRRRHVPAVLFLLALGVLAVGLARPHATVPVPTSGGTVILVIDASGSMDTADVGMPRIDAAKIAIREFIRKEPEGTRIGVVAFSAGAFLLTPPTTDREQVLGAVTYLSLSRGTNIGAGLQVALDALAGTDLTETPGMNLGAGVDPATARNVVTAASASTIVLLSDGASTVGPDPLAVAEQLARAGVRAFTVGLGARDGAGAFGGRGGFRQLDEPTLKGIAELTDGEYFTAEDAGQLSKVYGRIQHSLAFETRHIEVTYLTAAAGLLLLIGAGILGMMWSVRLP